VEFEASPFSSDVFKKGSGCFKAAGTQSVLYLRVCVIDYWKEAFSSFFFPLCFQKRAEL
jgi:hypothetical protein